ncbi:MAG: PAS domain S-box protein [Desulfobacteraceae bacterium]|jgi:PAS domain S-box-containing protein
MSEKPTYEEIEQRLRELEAAESEREKAQEALRASEELYRIMFEQARDVIYFTTPEGDLIDMNDAGLKLLGYPRGEFKQIDVGNHYVDPAQREEEKIELHDKGFIRDKEIRLIRKDGFEITCLDSATVMKNPDGSIKGYLGTLRDITPRKQAEEALKESEQKYKNLFENANEAIFVVQDRKLVFLNPKIIELTGYSAEELTSRPFLEFIYEDDKELVMNRHISRLKGENIPHTYSFRVLCKDGSIIWVELNAVLITWNGEIATLNFFSDTTERKRSEKALQESEERYRKILESIVDAYYELDLDGNLTFFNDSACALLGYTRDELLGMNYRQYTEERKVPELYEVFKEVYSTGKSYKGFDSEVIRKDRTQRYVEASITLIQDSDGNPVGFRGIARDVTYRKQVEVEQENLRQKLQQAQKMESIGTLAGGIAHNFNNVLMGIQGRASLMMMNKDSSHPDYEHLKGIQEYIKNATELTKDLLGFARGGKYEVQSTNLNKLIEHEIRMFSRTKKEIRVHEKYDKKLWTAEVDQGQIRQVLLNLYVNAWQAMPAGGDLYVQTENVFLSKEHLRTLKVQPGRYVKISVTDTGTGMDEATRQKIFDPFFSTKGMERGSGLGLASVYGIVQNHGGLIQVSTEKGKGTMFEIFLPASDKEIQEDSSDIHQQSLEYGRGTVLLVDDEAMVLEVGQMMLENLGYRVLIAQSGEEAIDLYDKEREEIDLIILDMIMPGMGGGEAFDRLKTFNPDVAVLLSSGYSINGQATEILDRGCNGFIQKPFTMEDLSRKINKILDR